MHVPGGGARYAACGAAALWCAVGFALPKPARADAASGGSPEVQVEQGDGSIATGHLGSVDAAGVRLADTAGGGPAMVVPVDRVRAVRREGVPADAARMILLTLVDGSTLTGDDFVWDGKQPAELLRPEGRISVPASRVRSVAIRSAAAGEPATDRWQDAVPESAASDLIVVGGGDGHEFVECAITAISSDAVTVILDEETIPVKRAKVLGMQWLRPDAAAAPPRLVVSVVGGFVRGSRVEWSLDGLVVDGDMRLPAAMLTGIDYATGRAVGLTGMAPEKVTVEPWFGSLARAAGLESFFAPRSMTARTAIAGRPDAPAASRSALIMRPRTVATWRLPADSRRLRTVLTAVGGPQAADAAVVIVSVDDREVLRHHVDATVSLGGDGAAAGVPVDVDLTNGRRLTVTVDFVSPRGVGAGVVFADPVIER